MRVRPLLLGLASLLMVGEPTCAQDAASPRLVIQTGHAFAPVTSGVDRSEERTASVTSLSVSADGGLLATGSEDGTARIWDVESGHEIRSFEMGAGGAVALSPDGSRLVAFPLWAQGGSGVPTPFAPIRMWHTETGGEVWRQAIASAVTSEMGIGFELDGGLLVSWSDFPANRMSLARLHPETGKLVWGKSCSPAGRGGLGVRPARFAVSAVGVHAVCHSRGPQERYQRPASDSVLAVGFVNVDDGRLASPFASPVTVGALAASAEGTRFAAAVGHTVQIGGADLSLSDRSIEVIPPGTTTGGMWDQPITVRALALSPDGRFVVTGTGNAYDMDYDAAYVDDPMGYRVDVWDAGSGQHLRQLGRAWASLRAITFLPDGAQVLVADARRAPELYEVSTGRLLRQFGGHAAPTRGVSFSPDGQTLMTLAGPRTVALWDLTTGRERLRIDEPWGVHAAVWTDDGATVFTGGRHPDGTIREARFGNRLRTIPTPDSVSSAALARAGTYLALSTQGGGLQWAALDGSDRMAPWLREPETAVRVPFQSSEERVSPQIRELATAVASGAVYECGWPYVHQWDAETLQASVVEAASSGDGCRSIAVDSVGHRVVTGQGGVVYVHTQGANGLRTTSLFFPANEEDIENPAWHIASVAMSTGGDRFAVGFQGGAIGVYAVPEQSETAPSWPVGEHDTNWVPSWSERLPVPPRLHSLDGHMATVEHLEFSPDGRLLASVGADGSAKLWDLDAGTELASLLSFQDGSWLVVAPDGRFDASSVEQVDGAVWVAPDDPLTPLPVEAFMRDFYEPRLLPRLLAGETLPFIGDLLDRNRVQPEVEITTVDWMDDGTAAVTVEVASAERVYGGQTRQSEVHDLRLFRDGQLVAWQDGAVVLGTEQQTIRFEGLAIPSNADTLTFSAYAFNADRVKSPTARQSVSAPPRVPRERRAYVVSLGVNTFEASNWDLTFAAADARAYQTALTDALRRSGMYAEVVGIPLVSALDSREGEAPATAAALRATLALLAGDPVSDADRALIPNADRLRRATPDDVVILTASTHGFTDDAGTFYLLPADIPATERSITPSLLDAAISSDELSAWLRGVDAGELAFIVDACFAASAVEGAGFKPGPMGSQGLGQLAYDKGMRILTATQSADVALESETLQRGLLTFALVENGLLAHQADGIGGQADGQISLAEWFAYGVDRVPTLYEELRNGTVQTFGRGLEVDGEVPSDAQTPSLFDFRRRPKPLYLVPPSR